MKLCYTVKIAPITKKNSQRIFTHPKSGKPFIAQSKQFKGYEQKALWFVKPRPAKPIDYPCNVQTVFYMPTRRRVDLVNLQEAILDILVLGGVLKDDNSGIVYSMDGSRVFYDKENPRTEITITEV